MIILYGVYNFSKRRVGFRNDFCNHCKAEHVAEQYRTFNMFHIFFVPVIPLGNCTHWHCTHCGKDPHERTKESPVMLIIGCLVFALGGVLLLYGSVAGQERRGMTAGMGLGFLAVSYGLWRLLKYQSIEKDGPPAGVQPLTGDTCPYCSGMMVNDPYIHCSGCKIRRY